MTHKTRLLGISLVVSVAAMIGCQQGPGNTQEAKTPQGPEIEQVTITIRSSDFRLSARRDFALAGYDVPELTKKIVDEGTVTGHYQFADGDTWHPMPFSIITDLGTSEISYSYSEGFLAVIVDGEIVTAGIVDIYDGDRVRFTLIPPGRLNPA